MNEQRDDHHDPEMGGEGAFEDLPTQSIVQRGADEASAPPEEREVLAADPVPREPREYRKGETISHYTLLARLGKGGFGEVWMAERTNPTMRIALKLTRADRVDKESLARFEAERQALALLDHPNIAKIHDAGYTDEGLPYFAMEYVKGEKITNYCDRLELSIDERLALFAKVCDAVHHAHTQGLIHRDLSPDNILVSVDPRTEGEPKIIDFGIAKAVNPNLILTERTLAVEVNVIIGKLEYMSPEQAEANQLEVDTRTDIFALGVILYELMTGVLPLPGEQLRRAALAELLSVVRSGARPEPSTKFRTLDAETQVTKASARGLRAANDLMRELTGRARHLPMTALRHERARRFSSAAAMARDIRNYLEDKPFVEAAAEKWHEKLILNVRRNPLPYAAAALIALSLIGGVIGTTIGMRRAQIAEQAERTAKNEAIGERDFSDGIVEVLTGIFELQQPGTSLDNTEIISRGEQLLPESIEDHPERAVRVHETLGIVLRGLNDMRGAETQLAEATRIADAFNVERDQNRLRLYYGLILVGLARDIAALEQLEGVTPATEAERTAHLTHTASALHNLGDYEVAEMRHREALDAMQAAQVGDEPVASQMILLARLLVDAGQVDEGLAIASEALPLRDAALIGATDRGKRMATSYLTLGYALHAAGQIDESGQAYERAEAEYAAHHQRDAPAVMTARAARACVLEDAGRLESDGSLLAPGIEWRDLGSWSNWANINLRNRGRILMRAGRIEDGNDRFERAVRIAETLIAEDPSDGLRAHLAHTYRVWGEMLIAADRPEEARAHLDRAARLQSEILPESLAFVTAPTQRAFGAIHTAQDDPAKAEQRLRRALALRRDHLDQGAWPIATAALALAEALEMRGSRQEALPLAREALAIFERDPELHRTRIEAARALVSRLEDG